MKEEKYIAKSKYDKININKIYFNNNYFPHRILHTNIKKSYIILLEFLIIIVISFHIIK